jgi:hypothetical protein
VDRRTAQFIWRRHESVGKRMSEFKYLAAWVKEQYPEGYLLTWLLSQPELWWCDGEIYQAALLRDGTALKNYIEKNEHNEMLLGITSKLSQDENWQSIAESLAAIFEVYQQHLSQLQSQRLQLGQLARLGDNAGFPGEMRRSIEVQKPLPMPAGDPLTGHE